MHEDTLLKTRQIKVKKTRYKIINLSTHFINEPLYMNFVTNISLNPVGVLPESGPCLNTKMKKERVANYS